MVLISSKNTNKKDKRWVRYRKVWTKETNIFRNFLNMFNHSQDKQVKNNLMNKWMLPCWEVLHKYHLHRIIKWWNVHTYLGSSKRKIRKKTSLLNKLITYLMSILLLSKAKSRLMLVHRMKNTNLILTAFKRDLKINGRNHKMLMTMKSLRTHQIQNSRIQMLKIKVNKGKKSPKQYVPLPVVKMQMIIVF